MFHSYREPPYKELCFCGDSINTCFYEEFFPIAKKEELPYRGCSPQHKLVRVFPIPDDARDAAGRFVGGTGRRCRRGGGCAAEGMAVSAPRRGRPPSERSAERMSFVHLR
jgi:hypothetical protein